MTRKHLLEDTARRFNEAGLEQPQREAEWLLMHLSGVDRAHLLAYSEIPVALPEQARLASWVEQRVRRVPLQYVIGETEFYGLTLRVSPDVLIPRPETEHVVEAALSLLDDGPRRVLDIGTGSGCIPLAIKHERPNADVSACDLSKAALRVASENAVLNGLQINLQEANVLADDFGTVWPEPFDLIVSNPPYVSPEEAPTLAREVRDHEPHLALFAAHPMQFYHAITRHNHRLLRPQGWLVFETHADHGHAVRSLVEKEGFSQVQLRYDLAGRPRVVVGQWKPVANPADRR